MRSMVLYETSHCHLCEQAEQLLLPLVMEAVCQIELIDIASDDALIAAYGTQIPVLKDNATGQQLKWPFDTEGVRAFLSSCQVQL